MATTNRDPRGILGLSADADPADVETQYEELQSFLDLRKVPKALRPWAMRQRVLVDEAYASAIGEGSPSPDEGLDEGETDGSVEAASPEAEDGDGSRDGWLDEATRDDPSADVEPDLVDDRPRMGGERSSPVPKAIREPGQPRQATPTFEIVTEDRQTSQSARGRPSPAPRRSDPPTNGYRSNPGAKHAQSNRSPEPRRDDTPVGDPDSRPTGRRGLPTPSKPWQRMLLGAVLGALVLGGLFVATRGVPNIGIASAQSSASSASQQAQVDEKRAAELRGIVAGDASNRDALFELGEMYIQAGRWQDSLDWFVKLLAVDPENLHARTDVGTDNFNLGRFDEARAAWEEVATRSPDDPQIHYNLGFLYASPHGKPADLAAARREWQKVIELAPNTELAKEAQSGLDTLAKQ